MRWDWEVTYWSRRLTAVVGVASAEDLTVDILRRLAVEGVAESDDLEFKLGLYDKGPAGNAELAADVASFANSSGGIIVLGIEEDRETSAAQGCPGVVTSDRERRRMLETIRSRVAPFPDFEIVTVAGDADLGAGKGFYCIAVERTAQAPHAVVAGTQLDFPVRNGTTTRHLSEPEVASAYADRSLGAAARASRLDNLWTSGTQSLQSSQAWAAMTIVPAIPGAVIINGSLVNRLASTWPRPWPISQHLQIGRTFVRAGMVVGDGGRAGDGGVSSYVRYELHTDGSVFFAHVVGAPPPHPNVGSVSQMITDQELAEFVLMGLQVVSRLAVGSGGVRGEATVRCGVHASNRVMLHLLDAARVYGSQWQPPDTDRGSISAPLSTTDLSLRPDDLTGRTAELITTAAVLGSALAQSLGGAELSHFRADGTVDVSQWPDPSAVQAWVASPT